MNFDLFLIHFQELRHEITIWQRAAASLSSYSKDENVVRLTLLKKVQRLLQQLKLKLLSDDDCLTTVENYKANLEELQAKVSSIQMIHFKFHHIIFVVVVFFFSMIIKK